MADADGRSHSGKLISKIHHIKAATASEQNAGGPPILAPRGRWQHRRKTVPTEELPLPPDAAGGCR